MKKKISFHSVDEYIAMQPAAAQPVLERVRGAIRKAIPDAQEVISYQMPVYRADGMLLYFAGWKEHYSVYPVTDGILADLGDELKDRIVSKGTMHFSWTEPVPVRLIGRIAKVRAKETAARVKARKKK